tara:strand:- start:626 stop:1150 length:525 start_codon:yes stop_codon:yes gene_type:complete
MYGQGLDVIAQLAPRSVDTLTTLLQVQGQLDHTGLSGAGGACVLPACNLQKMPNGGMNGLVLQLPETVPVMHLETLTNNVFDGVSMVRCANPSQIEERLKASGAQLHTQLQLFNTRERDLRHAQPSLEQVCSPRMLLPAARADQAHRSRRSRRVIWFREGSPKEGGRTVAGYKL